MGLDEVIGKIFEVETETVTLRLSRDASVLGVSFEGGIPVAAQAGELLSNIAVRAAHAVTYDCRTGWLV